MTHNLSSIMSAVVGTAILTVSSAHAITLVEEGAPRAVLIVEVDSPKAMHAAEALQTYIEKMSGVELPLVIEGEDPPENAPAGRVHVGQTAAAQGQNVPAGFDPSVRDDAFEEEGYVLRTLDENTLLVAGNNDGPYRGTVFAAYALLEKLGCRFYFPGEWGEIVPQKDTVSVPNLDVLERPDFAWRHIPLSGWVRRTREESEAYREWGYKIGFSADRLHARSSDGSMGGLLPHREYFDEYPEFYAMNRQGERRPGSMLCLSSEAMFEKVVERLRRGLEGEENVANIHENWPGYVGIGFAPPDGAPYCFCDDCKEASQNFRYRYYGQRDDRPMMSEQFFEFTARIAREFPDLWISTGAYSLREAPPQGVDLPDNVAIWHAPITVDVLRPGDTEFWRRTQFMEWLAQWREQTRHVYIYDYNPGLLTGMFVPERDAENMAINAPMYRDLDILGMRREGRKAFMQTWISYYVTAKLLWDANACLEEIKEDFYPTFFGEDAGRHVRAWWDACAERLLESNAQAHEDWIVNDLYNKDFTDRIHEHVESALAADMTEVQRERVEAFALIAENLESFAEMNDAWRHADWQRAAEAAGRMVELKEELNEAYSFLISPDHRDARGYFAAGHKQRFEGYAEKTGGAAGELVAALPLEMRFRRDPFEEGVPHRWYLSGHDDTDWEMRDTFYLLEQQEEPLNERGFHYSGYVWYRGEIDIPERFVDRDVNLYIGGLINEGWVWINGEYVGHRPWAVWWSHSRHPAEFSVGDKLRPGERNTIAIRVLNDPDEVGGLYRRGFLHAPHAEAE